MLIFLSRDFGLITSIATHQNALKLEINPVKKPETPSNESVRLERLRSLNILDTPPEERFDRLTRLAKRLFNVPIALVSLIDEDRQWFKSCQGLSTHETPRDISFCGHAILTDEVFIIPDATKNQDFADNPLVLGEPYIRFYAGYPLKHIDGSKLGTLCIIDQHPRTISADDIESLKDLAELVERELMTVELAKMDDLTKLLNRKGFLIHAQNSLNLCMRQKIVASVVFIDLDKFKRINDEFGHAEGDDVLSVLADHMRRIFRTTDVISRLGGDEFAVLLTGSNHEQAKDSIARLRDSIKTYNQALNKGYTIEFSDGIVTLDFAQESAQAKQELSIDAILQQADMQMYQNKSDKNA